MTIRSLVSQLEKTFGRNSEAYIMQIINDGLLDIANKKQGYTVSATTDLEKNKRWYDLPATVLGIDVLVPNGLAKPEVTGGVGTGTVGI